MKLKSDKKKQVKITPKVLATLGENKMLDSIRHTKVKSSHKLS